MILLKKIKMKNLVKYMLDAVYLENVELYSGIFWK